LFNPSLTAFPMMIDIVTPPEINSVETYVATENSVLYFDLKTPLLGKDGLAVTARNPHHGQHYNHSR